MPRPGDLPGRPYDRAGVLVEHFFQLFGKNGEHFRNLCVVEVEIDNRLCESAPRLRWEAGSQVKESVIWRGLGCS